MNETAGAAPGLKRELGLRDTTLFAITTIVGTRWIVAAAHAGPGSVALWALAAVLMMVPLSVAVAALTVKYPGTGGLYRWTREDFGAWHGFLCFWVYWLGLAFWFPSAAMFYMSVGLRALGPGYAHMADSRWWVVGVSMAAIWAALGTNLVGLRVGKWTENAGGVSAWVLGIVLAGAAALAWVKRGSATPLHFAPEWNWGTVSFWATMAYGMTGIELAGMMGAEIRDPERTLPRAAWIASGFSTLFYSSATVALLVLLPPEGISELHGFAQSGEEASRVLGLAWISPVVALLVMMSAVGQFGGIGSAVSRLPLAAGVDHLLPAAFGRIHPRWSTPHFSILTLGAVSSLLLVVLQLGDTMRAAYQALVSLMLIGGFLPFFYIFSSGWKAGRRRSALVGLAANTLFLFCAVIPSDEVGSIWVFEAKLGLGTLAMVGSAWWMYRRRNTACKHMAADTQPGEFSAHRTSSSGAQRPPV